MLWTLTRSLLFLLPPEFTHTLSKFGIRILALFLPLPKNNEYNPIGLAAGFDKNCDVLPYLPYFGFGHAEIGTVTPLPQAGNDKPRLFREPKNKVLFNRMGFNNLGCEVVAARLQKIKPKLPTSFKVGVNLGKNKATPDTEAASDYAKVAEAFKNLADYFVINVSSPNTPGLRALQTPEALLPIVDAVKSVLMNSNPVPIYVKLAPEIQGSELKILIEALEAAGIAGFVLTNTLGGTREYRKKEFTGGYSGQILSSISLERLLEVHSYATLPIISVGGIMTVEDAKLRLQSGASEIQIYTGWVFGGPFLIKRILKSIQSRDFSIEN